MDEATGFIDKRRSLSVPSRVPEAHDRLFFIRDAPVVWSEATGFIDKWRGLSVPSRVPKAHDRLFL